MLLKNKTEVLAILPSTNLPLRGKAKLKINIYINREINKIQLQKNALESVDKLGIEMIITRGRIGKWTGQGRHLRRSDN